MLFVYSKTIDTKAVSAGGVGQRQYCKEAVVSMCVAILGTRSLCGIP